MAIGIVSVYPPRGEHHAAMSGVASMAKNIAQTVSVDETVHVVTNSVDGESDRYVEDNIVVHRCWEPGVRYPFQIVRALLSIDDLDVVHIHHEYDGMYGGIASNALFPLLLLGLHLTGARIVTQPHGVVFDTELIDTKGVDSPLVALPETLLELVLVSFNQLLVWLSHTVVVPNSALERDISNHCLMTEKSLAVVPHGVEPNVIAGGRTPPDEEFTILYFGYITWRKGPDIIVEAAKSLPDEWRLVLAGGQVPYLADNSDYQQYYEAVQSTADRLENITLTGFVDEADLDRYFTQADVLVLPYRKFIAASGVFSLGLRYSVPFLLSEELSPLLENEDASQLLQKHDIDESDLSFSLEEAGQDLEHQIRSLCEENERYNRVAAFSEALCEAREWDQLRSRYMELYYPAENDCLTHE